MSTGINHGEVNVFAFETGPLSKAGEYAATVGYAEQRPELCKALSKKEATLRSPASAFEVGQQCYP